MTLCPPNWYYRPDRIEILVLIFASVPVILV